MWKWLKALNPFESDNYAPWMREEIAALRDQLDAAEIELADKAFYVREFAAVSRERNEYKNLLDVRTKDLDSQEKNARIVAALKRVEYTGHATSLPDAVEWCVDRIAGLTAELQERRAEQAPLGDEVIALRKQVSDLRSKHTETCVHNGQIAMLLAQAWEQIAKLGGDPITENALIEHIKAGRKRDMETVKQYAEEAGQLRNTITAIKAELKERRAEQAPMGDEIVNLRAELAALRERATVPAKVRFDVTVEEACEAVEETVDRMADDDEVYMRNAIDCLASHAAVPVPAGVPSVRDLREIGVHAYLSHDSAKRENAGCMVGPMGAAADAILTALAPYLRDPVGWKLDVTAEDLSDILLPVHRQSVTVRQATRTILDLCRSRIRPTFECKECAVIRAERDEINKNYMGLVDLLLPYLRAAQAEAAARAALEGE